ncbi:hypothetical protein CI610_00181 [invertebrate metagenome]|uniref:Uncharacterized protein n=1 Tax=invertebrate metagenome TaxID=1711999 RepID=A0A2H9TCL1_9ZZZZ
MGQDDIVCGQFLYRVIAVLGIAMMGMVNFAEAEPAMMNQVVKKQTFAESKPDLEGKWVNQRGSSLSIQNGSEGVLKGTFTTAVAKTKNCIGLPVSFTGAQNGNAIAFSFSMAPGGSPVVIATTGLLVQEKGMEQLKTFSSIQYQGKDEWNSRVVCNDVYKRVVVKKSNKGNKK